MKRYRITAQVSVEGGPWQDHELVKTLHGGPELAPRRAAAYVRSDACDKFRLPSRNRDRYLRVRRTKVEALPPETPED